MINKHSQVRPEFTTLDEKRLDTWNNFLDFFYEEKWVRIAMSRFYDEFMWWDQIHHITKNVMKAIIGLSDSREIPPPKCTKNKDVMELIGATFDKHHLAINTIWNLTVKYLSMVVGNTIYLTNRDNSISATIVHMAYEMAKLKKDYDLCEILRQQLLENLVQCRKKKHPFKFGTLALCIMFYFL